ncbi:MAG: hypothetical protein U1E17_20290 [Geminicoccaceae bacterium]
MSLFATGRIVDLMLAFTLVEAVVLMLWRWRTGRGPAPDELFVNLLSGVCLMLALRAALIDAWWGWIACWLVAALLAHLLDLRRRWAG